MKSTFHMLYYAIRTKVYLAILAEVWIDTVVVDVQATLTHFHTTFNGSNYRVGTLYNAQIKLSSRKHNI